MRLKMAATSTSHRLNKPCTSLFAYSALIKVNVVVLLLVVAQLPHGATHSLANPGDDDVKIHFGPWESSGRLAWFTASDTHIGGDFWDNTTTTGLQKAQLAVDIMNALPNSKTQWPAAVGGGNIHTPAGVVVTGDLIDNGFTEYKQWLQFEKLFGLHGNGDGKLRYPVFEMRGNHDGANTTDYEQPPSVQGGNFVARGVVARTRMKSTIQRRLTSRGPLPPSPATFRLTAISQSGLHYSWDWKNADGDVGAHMVALNLYVGDTCTGCAPYKCFYGPPCAASWEYPEHSRTFLQKDLALYAKDPNTPVFVHQHYGMDGFSNLWYSEEQRIQFHQTLVGRATLPLIFVGHTHAAQLYWWNGTHTGARADLTGEALPVANTPSTNKEPTQIFAVELRRDASSGALVLRVALRTGDSWGDIAGNVTLSRGTDSNAVEDNWTSLDAAEVKSAGWHARAHGESLKS